MSLILGFLLTGIAAIAGTVLCPPPAGKSRDRNGSLGLALAATLAASMVLAHSPAGAAGRLVGPAEVIAGSTLAVDGIPVSLAGIIAPALDATCWDAQEKPYACGQRARVELAGRIGTGVVMCDWSDGRGRRMATATCRAGDTDLGEWMIEHGYAVPASEASATYRAAGDRAWGRRAGLWAGVFADPAGWSEATEAVVSRKGGKQAYVRFPD